MMRLLPVFLGFLLLAGQGAPVWAASPKAMALRQANGLIAFTPTAKFLAGNFVADEMNPSVIFGAVKNFAASRKCPTAWLIEKDQKDRLAGACACRWNTRRLHRRGSSRWRSRGRRRR